MTYFSWPWCHDQCPRYTPIAVYIVIIWPIRYRVYYMFYTSCFLIHTVQNSLLISLKFLNKLVVTLKLENNVDFLKPDFNYICYKISSIRVSLIWYDMFLLYVLIAACEVSYLCMSSPTSTSVENLSRYSLLLKRKLMLHTGVTLLLDYVFGRWLERPCIERPCVCGRALGRPTYRCT